MRWLRAWREGRKFAVIEGQIAITHVQVVRRSRGCCVAEIGTRQKYPEWKGGSGTEILIGASERTHKDSYDSGRLAAIVAFPRRMRGWKFACENGRYTIYLVLYRPAQRRSADLMISRDEEWWRRLRT